MGEYVSAALEGAAHSAYHQLGPIGPRCGQCGQEALRMGTLWHCAKCGVNLSDPQLGCPFRHEERRCSDG